MRRQAPINFYDRYGTALPAGRRNRARKRWNLPTSDFHGGQRPLSPRLNRLGSFSESVNEAVSPARSVSNSRTRSRFSSRLSSAGDLDKPPAVVGEEMGDSTLAELPNPEIVENGPAEEEQRQEEEEEENGGAVVPQLSNSLLQVLDENEEDDICDTCRFREMQLLAAATQQARDRHQEKEEEEALVAYVNEQAKQEAEKDQKQKNKRKEIEQDVGQRNRRIAEEKKAKEREQNSDADRTRANLDTEDTSYLFYKRPDTAKTNRDKQRQLRAQLIEQVEAKREMERKQKDMDNHSWTAQNSNMDTDISRGMESTRVKDAKKKEEYRKALDAQIAARVVNEAGAGVLPWWTKQRAKQPDKEEEELRGDGQKQRISKQDAAIERLEGFVANQRAEDEERRAKERERRQLHFPRSPSLPPPSERIVTERSERSKAVEDAWITAASQRQEKFDTLQHGQQDSTGCILDQLRRYRRCRRCNKAIAGPPPNSSTRGGPSEEPKGKGEKFWYDVSAASGTPFNRTPHRVMSRHGLHVR